MQTPKTPKRALSKKQTNPSKRRKTLALQKKSTGSIYYGPSVSAQFVTKPLRFSQRLQFTSTTGAVALATYRANGLFLPVSGGHQPRGFDQWSLLYNKYVVTKAKITVDFVSATSTGGECLVGVTVSTLAASSSDIRDYTESRFTNYAISGDQSVVRRVEQVWDYTQWKKGSIMADSEVQALTTANPSEQYFFNVFAADLIAANTGTVYGYATVEYETRFFDPIDPSIS